MRLEARQEALSKPALPLSDNGVRVVVVCAIFMPLATIAVGLRFYARYLKRIAYSLDDWCLLASLVCSS